MARKSEPRILCFTSAIVKSKVKFVCPIVMVREAVPKQAIFVPFAAFS